MTSKQRTLNILTELDMMLLDYNDSNHEKIINSLRFISNELEREEITRFIKEECFLEHEEMILELIEHETIDKRKAH